MSAVESLAAMGFPVERCEEALRRTDGDAEMAMEYLLSGSQDSPEASTAADQSFVPNEELITVLTGFGFHAEAAAEALRATNNDVDGAMNWLIDTAEADNSAALSSVSPGYDDGEDDNADNMSQVSQQSESSLATGEEDEQEHDWTAGRMSQMPPVHGTLSNGSVVTPSMNMSARTPAPPPVGGGGVDATDLSMSLRTSSRELGHSTAPRQVAGQSAHSQGFTVPGAIDMSGASISSSVMDPAPSRHRPSPAISALGRAERVRATDSNPWAQSARRPTSSISGGITPNNLFRGTISGGVGSSVRRMPTMDESTTSQCTDPAASPALSAVMPAMSPKVRFVSNRGGVGEGNDGIEGDAGLRREMEAASMRCEMLNHQLEQERAVSMALRQQLQQKNNHHQIHHQQHKASMPVHSQPPLQLSCAAMANRASQRAQLSAYLTRRLNL